jgi:plasmid stabilization system protein ParE
MTPRYLIRPEAQADIEEAALWYEDQRPVLGETFTTELFELIDRIAQSPLQFPVVGLSTRRGLLQRFPYAVFFLLDEGSLVVVLAVLHQRRNPAIWKRRARRKRSLSD